MNDKYVHGYTEVESNRLNDQAITLSALLHHDSIFPKGGKVLEIGCGVGAQTEILCRKNPNTHFTSVDISKESLNMAQSRCSQLGFKNVNFLQADVYDLPFETGSFDHVFICFFLEHLPDPDKALRLLRSFVRAGGTITAIEGDHGSAYFYPESTFAQATINCLIKLQSENGGNSLIGRSLFPLFTSSGLSRVVVSPRVVYADDSLPEMVDGFTRKTFIAMVEGVEKQAIERGLITKSDWKRGITDLNQTASSKGVFCYTFFKAIGFC
jgi:SAM-dependent methyltransferase